MEKSIPAVANSLCFRTSEPGLERAVTLGSFGGLTGILLHSLTDFNLDVLANDLLFAVPLGLAYKNSLRNEL